MVIKYNNIYHSKALQNLPKFGIFGLKTNHLATLLSTTTRAPKNVCLSPEANPTTFYLQLQRQRCSRLERFSK
jgi:hypothetical protein